MHSMTGPVRKMLSLRCVARLPAVAGFAALALMAVGCHSTRPVKPTPVAPTGGVPPECTGVTPSKEMRRAAMLSVYFYSSYATSDWMPAELRPIDLTEAACILAAYEGRLAESRRRRAIANLAAAGMDDPNRCTALKTLHAPIHDIQNLFARTAGVDIRRGGDATPNDCVVATSSGVNLYAVDVDANQMVSAILELLTRLGGEAIPGCKGSATTDVDFDVKTWETTATVEASVERDLSEVCPQMDPQNWDADDCSDYFTTTYIAKKIGGTYPIKVDYSVEPDPNPPAPCTKYDRELFEHFDVAFKAPIASNLSIVTAWYKQLLTIDSHELTAIGSEGHVYVYKLYKAIRSRVGLDVRPGGLATNAGTLTVQRSKADPTFTDLKLTKTVLFSGRPWLDSGLNLWAGIFLKAMGGELHEMACCKP